MRQLLGGDVSANRTGRGILAVALAAALLAGCSEDRGDDTASGGSDGTQTTTGQSAEASACGEDLLACARNSSIADLIPDEVTEATGEPIVIGMINQENSPVASFPELSDAIEAGVEWVNAELGGVNGRPIELEVCNSEFSPEGSTACAQDFAQRGVPAVLGGIDVFGNGIITLAENGIPFVGGIPVSEAAVTSPNSFQWSGGTWGATIAFAHHAATEEGAESVAVVYSDYGPIGDSASYGEQTLRAAGVEDITMVPYPITATDLSSPLQAAAAAQPDAMIILAADSGCKGTYDGLATLGIDVPVYLVGACATPAIVEEAGPEKVNGTIFNVEGPVDRQNPDPDVVLYTAIVEAYGDGLDPVGAGTVSFRSFINLYRVMVDLDGEPTAEAITEALRSQVDAPSFMGHPSTCDGNQLAGLPALCSPQQILVRAEDDDLVQISDWIDVGEIFGGS